MAGERQLARRREDANPVVGTRHGRREQEGRLAQMGPARERLHPRIVERVGAVHDGERIALQRRRGEDIELVEAKGRHQILLGAVDAIVMRSRREPRRARRRRAR
jgi:hypothetical protein